jgi:hypothetical protein
MGNYTNGTPRPKQSYTISGSEHLTDVVRSNDEMVQPQEEDATSTGLDFSVPSFRVEESQQGEAALAFVFRS